MTCDARRWAVFNGFNECIREPSWTAEFVRKIKLRAAKSIVSPLRILGFKSFAIIAGWSTLSVSAPCRGIDRRAALLYCLLLLVDMLEISPKPIWQILGDYVNPAQAPDICLLGSICFCDRDRAPVIPGLVSLLDLYPTRLLFLWIREGK